MRHHLLVTAFMLWAPSVLCQAGQEQTTSVSVCSWIVGSAAGDQTTTEEYRYERGGRLASAWYTVGTNTAALCYQYDRAGNRVLECRYGPGSESVDTDGSGLTDLWQWRYFGCLGNDPANDPDGDGANNGEEFYAGTDPADGSSALEVTACGQPQGITNGYVIHWGSVTGKSYTLQFATNLVHGFSARQPHILSTPPENVYTDAVITVRSVFYRVEVE